MPKSKNNRKGKKRVGDKRPVARSGRNEGRADYRTAKPIDEPGAPPNRQCAYLDRIATLPNIFTPEECNQIINTALNDWQETESKIQRDKGTEIKQNFEEDHDYRNTTLFIPDKPDEWLFQKILNNIMSFNQSEQGYNFDIHGLAEPPNVMRYQAPDINIHGKPGNIGTAPMDGPKAAPDRQCAYLDRIATLPNVFTADECNQIINTALNDWQEKESMIQRDKGTEIKQNFEEDHDYRNTTLFIPPKPDEWLFGKIMNTIMSFNTQEQGWQFDIHGLAEPPNVMRYQAPDINVHGKPGKYDWHMDVGPGPVPSMRKLSYSILLNPGEYEGGELAFHIGRNTDPYPGQTEKEAIGNMVLFPSYCVHRVQPMTKGTRYAVVGWAHGNSFK